MVFLTVLMITVVIVYCVALLGKPPAKPQIKDDRSPLLRNYDVSIENYNQRKVAAIEKIIPVREKEPVRAKKVLPINTNLSFVAIDFETANRRRGSACAIGMCKVEKGIITDRYVKLLRPEPFEFEHQNVNLHGITAERTRNAPTIKEDWNNIKQFVGDLPLVAHNASFDKSVLESSLKACDGEPSGWVIDCTLLLAKRLFADRANYKLSELSQEFDIELSHHDAGSDAEACAQLMLHLSTFENRPLAKLNTSIKEDKVLKSEVLSGLRIVFTGDVPGYSREDMKFIAESHGAIVTTGVSRKTNLLVVGDINYSNKIDKARELNTKIIKPKDFFSMITKHNVSV